MSKPIQKWLKIARTELHTAKTLTQLGVEHGPTILFLSQQVAEKSIKAYLTFQGSKIKKTHDLNELIKDVKDNSLKMLIMDSHTLSQYVSKFRYPQLVEETPTLIQIQEALQLAESVYNSVILYLDK